MIKYFLAISIFFTGKLAIGAGEKVVLIAHGGIGNPFWSVVFNGAKQAAKDLNVSVKILFPNKDGDQSGTTQKLSEAISTNPDGIAVTLATTAHCEYLKEAQNKKIPVVVFNAKAKNSDKNCPFLAYVGMDEYLAGRTSAQRALSKIPVSKVKNQAVVALTEAGHAGLQARAKGVKDVLSEKGYKVDIIDIGNDPSAVPTRFRGYYKRNQGNLAGIFVPSPNGMHPIMRMKQQDPGGLGKIYSASFDLTPLIISGIEKKIIDHTIDQQPYLQGYYSVSQLVMSIRGKFRPMDMNTGVGVVDVSNAKEVLSLVKKKMR